MAKAVQLMYVPYAVIEQQASIMEQHHVMGAKDFSAVVLERIIHTPADFPVTVLWIKTKEISADIVG